ncbi:MAG: 5-formyltetrahydrofolate cyclo-ligase [Streptosporangiales bacterium]|nr:5-formyltetrahydrofolate cyclo-ligase [Streptosporangiales bacterium]
MTEEARVAAGSVLRETVLADPRLTMGGTVAAYYSFGTEPDTRRLVFALWKHGAYVLLPVLRPDGDLDWAEYDGPDTLAPGERVPLEPTGPRHGVDAVRRCAAVIVPALAVDLCGIRLGRGGGSFDRALARAGAGTLTLALAYDGEVVPELPAEPHDTPVRAVATPSRGIQALPAGAGNPTPGG